MTGDGAECVEMQIATRAYLSGEGFDFRHAFAVCIVRADGERVDLVCESLPAVAYLVATLTPPHLGLSCGGEEVYGDLLAAIRSRLPSDSRGTLH